MMPNVVSYTQSQIAGPSPRDQTKKRPGQKDTHPKPPLPNG